MSGLRSQCCYVAVKEELIYYLTAVEAILERGPDFSGDELGGVFLGLQIFPYMEL